MPSRRTLPVVMGATVLIVGIDLVVHPVPAEVRTWADIAGLGYRIEFDRGELDREKLAGNISTAVISLRLIPIAPFSVVNYDGGRGEGCGASGRPTQTQRKVWRAA